MEGRYAKTEWLQVERRSLQIVCMSLNRLFMNVLWAIIPAGVIALEQVLAYTLKTNMYMRTQNKTSSLPKKTMYYVLVAFTAISILAQLLVKVLEH